MFKVIGAALFVLGALAPSNQTEGSGPGPELTADESLWRALEGRHLQALSDDRAGALLATSSVLVHRQTGERVASEIRLFRQADMVSIGAVRVDLDLHSGGDSWACDIPWRVIRLAGDYAAVAVDRHTSELVTARFNDGAVIRPIKGVRAVLDEHADTEAPRVLLSTDRGICVWNPVNEETQVVIPRSEATDKQEPAAACFNARRDGTAPEVWACWGGEQGATLLHWRQGESLRAFSAPCLSGSAGGRLTLALHNADDEVRVAIGQPGHDEGRGRLALIEISAEQAAGRVESLYCGRRGPEDSPGALDQRNFGHSPVFLHDGRLVVGSPWALVPSVDLLDGDSGALLSEYLVHFTGSISHSLTVSGSGEIIAGGAYERGYPESLWGRGAVYFLNPSAEGSIEVVRRHEFRPAPLMPK